MGQEVPYHCLDFEATSNSVHMSWGVLITKEGSRGAAIDCLVTGGWVEHQVDASRVFSFIIITVKDSLLFTHPPHSCTYIQTHCPFSEGAATAAKLGSFRPVLPFELNRADLVRELDQFPLSSWINRIQYEELTLHTWTSSLCRAESIGFSMRSWRNRPGPGSSVELNQSDSVRGTDPIEPSFGLCLGNIFVSLIYPLQWVRWSNLLRKFTKFCTKPVRTTIFK